MPFTEQEFIANLAHYNEAIWPLPIAAYLIAAIAVGLSFWENRASAILTPPALALLWLINGIVYHAQYFTAINPLAMWFAILFVLEAILLAVSPLLFGNMHFKIRLDIRSAAGLGLILFAMVVYPVWGKLAGHSYPATPVFGVTPCPTTIFTIGMLLLANWEAARWLIVLPAAWAVIGGSAAFLLGVPQDLGLLVAVAIVMAIAFVQAKISPTGPSRSD